MAVKTSQDTYFTRGPLSSQFNVFTLFISLPTNLRFFVVSSILIVLITINESHIEKEKEKKNVATTRLLEYFDARNASCKQSRQRRL